MVNTKPPPTPNGTARYPKHDLWWKPAKCLETGLVDVVWDGTEEGLTAA